MPISNTICMVRNSVNLYNTTVYLAQCNTTIPFLSNMHVIQINNCYDSINTLCVHKHTMGADLLWHSPLPWRLAEPACHANLARLAGSIDNASDLHFSCLFSPANSPGCFDKGSLVNIYPQTDMSIYSFNAYKRVCFQFSSV